jgi:hypothetical protein
VPVQGVLRGYNREVTGGRMGVSLSGPFGGIYDLSEQPERFRDLARCERVRWQDWLGDGSPALLLSGRGNQTSPGATDQQV